MRKQDANARSHLDGLLDVVSDHEDALEIRDLLLPERDDFVTQSFGSQNIEGAKGFVEAEQSGERPSPNLKIDLA